MSVCRFLVINGVVSQTSEVPPVASFLESHPAGAYTTSRTHNKASCLLFWERHLRRLVDSARILAESRPDYLFGSEKARVSFSSLSTSSWESIIQPMVSDSLRNVLPMALKDRSVEEELVITAIVSGNSNNVDKAAEDREKERTFRVLDVYLHIGVYVPPVFGSRENSAHLAVVGPGRDTAKAKFSDWVRLRKYLENLRPPSVNELVLSNDGDRILEGCVTNFFVVCRKENSDALRECPLDLDSEQSFEVQTASISDGVLPGVIRQVVVDVCLARGISFREVAPSWSEHELWEEAFITNSLRLVQHVETICVPSSWEQLEHKTWEEVSWKEKRFKERPGIITAAIQREIMKRASLQGHPVSDYI
ncbi:Aminotransferase [Macleaya cordata]|uniref:Aminotransferase n=1 Tax=Macleaya cordata TaxID=56857 RepID=A0A200QSW0_MACCD|nr:Aminotransferase [Macleaya cordata]